MYDLHAHILPGVDDGAKTIEDAVEMARVAADNGTEVILATPHRKDISENHSVPYVRDLLAQLNLDLELPEDFSTGRALTISGSRYALVELPFFGYPNYAEDILFQIQVQGVTPVLAHPERIEAIQRNPNLLAGFVERGMLSQVTAGSVVGHFGGKVRRITRSLLKRGLVHIIASDTHFPGGPRSPLLTPGMEAAASIVGYERARAMVVGTPKAILDDLPVEVELPSRVATSRRWWRPWTT